MTNQIYNRSKYIAKQEQEKKLVKVLIGIQFVAVMGVGLVYLIGPMTELIIKVIK